MSIARKRWMIEGLWLAITAVLAVLVVMPILSSGIDFPHLFFNLMYVFLGLTCGRYIVNFNNHPLEQSRVFKVLLIFAVPFLFFPILEGLHSFIEFNDREGLQSIMSRLTINHQNWLIRYIRFEYLVFGISSMVGSFFLIIKMIRSLWRQYKYGDN